MRGGTKRRRKGVPASFISIHPPHAGRDCGPDEPLLSQSKFQSTRPMRGGTLPLYGHAAQLCISIHPPRAGRDLRSRCRWHPSQNFNPPAPCGAGLSWVSCGSLRGNFNPPAPCGAGPAWRDITYFINRISIHPPRAGRDYFGVCLLPGLGIISIHPPRAGRDKQGAHSGSSSFGFQSTRPVRGGTT